MQQQFRSGTTSKTRPVTSLVVCFVLFACQLQIFAADDVTAAYQRIQPSLVKVWAFDSLGTPTQSGTGFIVSSGSMASYVLTAAHVVSDATKLSVDLNKNLNDVAAEVVARTDNPDVALLKIEHGGLTPVIFVTTKRIIQVGTSVAVAGYLKSDEQIGLTGQAPRLRYPATVSSLADDGKFLELGLSIEDGLSGAPVFDPSDGAVIGMIQTRANSSQSGYAVSAPLVLLQFLRAHQVAVSLEAAPAPSSIGHVSEPLTEPKPAAPRQASSQQSGESAYRRILDGLNSTDLTTQLATLDEAAQSKNRSLRQLAFSTALGSKQEQVRAAALNATIASTPSFVVQISKSYRPSHTDPYGNGALYSALETISSFAVYVHQFEPATGAFLGYTDYSKAKYTDNHPIVFSNGTVAGERITFAAHFDQRSNPYGNPGGYGGLFNCHGSANLKGDSTSMYGSMSCDSGDINARFDIEIQLLR